MKPAPKFVVVLVTTPDLATARVIAHAALEERWIACANLLPKVESHYWWQGRIESSTEVLLVMKTTRARLKGLEKVILARHPYDTPEIVALPLDSGNERYLAWLENSVSAESQTHLC